jgi:serine/threonine protein kinase
MDARADVYAIGAVGYFLVTGSPVFAGSSVADICLMHVTATPPSPSARATRPVSPQLEAILLRCLAKSPSDRPDDAGALLHLLETCPVSGNWTAAHAADWWADHTSEHVAAEKKSIAAVPVADVQDEQ